MPELFHRLPGNIPVPAGPEKFEVGLLHPENHLRANGIQIRTGGVPLELLDLDLRGGLAEVVEILAQIEPGGVAVVNLRPARRRIRSAVSNGSVDLRIIPGSGLTDPAVPGPQAALGRLDVGMPRQRDGNAPVEIQHFTLPDRPFRNRRRPQRPETETNADQKQKQSSHIG